MTPQDASMRDVAHEPRAAGDSGRTAPSPISEANTATAATPEPTTPLAEQDARPRAATVHNRVRPQGALFSRPAQALD
ncbi:hypothetical protein TRAPUB_5862 [Trametes pubescens]|uniref:Uncharacterized protein n=1 Tax=Trametes pubescens TaxID=154538 RepID=A0A1M2V7B8_TRAPU|nr:hypothetical protein TRAPUB_5862 [Trametes pubescens]